MVIDSNGKSHWISRSDAVVIIVNWNNKYLILKRGPNVSYTNHWCVPCGYLDWDESLKECCIREIWEESGINLNDYNYSKSLDSPYDIVSDPTINHNQDIALHYWVKIFSDEQPKINTDIVDKNEVLEVKWIDSSEVNDYEYAFNHKKRLNDFIDKKLKEDI